MQVTKCPRHGANVLFLGQDRPLCYIIEVAQEADYIHIANPGRPNHRGSVTRRHRQADVDEDSSVRLAGECHAIELHRTPNPRRRARSISNGALGRQYLEDAFSPGQF